jgi:hypothetical protein
MAVSNDLLELIKQNGAFTLRVKDLVFTVPLKDGGEVFEKLQACADANDPSKDLMHVFQYGHPN